jgi:hypothetical protein
MNAIPLHRSQDLIPIPAGLLTPRDVYDFAKARADALRAEIAAGAK